MNKMMNNELSINGSQPVKMFITMNDYVLTILPDKKIIYSLFHSLINQFFLRLHQFSSIQNQYLNDETTLSQLQNLQFLLSYLCSFQSELLSRGIASVK